MTEKISGKGIEGRPWDEGYVSSIIDELDGGNMIRHLSKFGPETIQDLIKAGNTLPARIDTRRSFIKNAAVQIDQDEENKKIGTIIEEVLMQQVDKMRHISVLNS